MPAFKPVFSRLTKVFNVCFNSQMSGKKSLYVKSLGECLPKKVPICQGRGTRVWTRNFMIRGWDQACGGLLLLSPAPKPYDQGLKQRHIRDSMLNKCLFHNLISVACVSLLFCLFSFLHICCFL